jgi:excisionase family DNA binding protein
MLTPKQAAVALGLKPKAVLELAKRGELTHYRFGAAVRFERSDVNAYKNRNAPRLVPARVLREYERLRLRVPEAERLPPLSPQEQAIAERRIRRERMPPWADGKAIRALREEARRLTRETGIVHHVDHEIPLQGEFVSGLHVETNMQILTGADNLRKKNRFEVG